MTNTPTPQDEVDRCKSCGMMKHLDADGLCGRCVKVTDSWGLDEELKALNQILDVLVPPSGYHDDLKCANGLRCFKHTQRDKFEALLVQARAQGYAQAKADAVKALPADDIDEQLSAQYDLVIPQGVHGFRVAVAQYRKAIEELKEKKES